MRRRPRGILAEVTSSRVVLSPIGQVVQRHWLRIEEVEPTVEVREFVVMPDHLHGILLLRARPMSPAPGSEAPAVPLGAIIGRFKSISAREANIVRGTVGRPFWQRGFHDRVIRDDQAFRRIREYIIRNPLHWEPHRDA